MSTPHKPAPFGAADGLSLLAAPTFAHGAGDGGGWKSGRHAVLVVTHRRHGTDVPTDECIPRRRLAETDRSREKDEKARDAVCSGSNLNASPKPEGCAALDGLIEFRARHSQEARPSRPVFGNNFAQVFRRKLTVPIRRQAVGSFPSPKFIDAWVSPIEAVEHVLNQRDTVFRR
jgi:hypothetical protein